MRLTYTGSECRDRVDVDEDPTRNESGRALSASQAATGTLIGMRVPRHITIPVLIAAALLGGGAGCTNSTPHPSSTQRPGATGSPIPTPMATPSSYTLPHIATSSWRLGDVGLDARLHAKLSLSSDGRCLVVGDHDLVVWPAGYSVVLREGRVTVLDETGAEAARLGDLITAVGGPGDIPANACGLRTRKQITCTYTFLGVTVVLCRLPWMSKSRWRESLPRCFPILMSVSDG